MESYSRWEPVAGIDRPCSFVVLHAGPSDLWVRLSFASQQHPTRELLLTFGREVVACMSHEEFVHPWQADDEHGDVPRLTGPGAQYAFPLLLVESSRWLASFADSQILDADRPRLRHYRFVSLDNTVDVLAAGDVKAEWVAPAT